MQTYRTETIIAQDGMLIVRGVPFHAGDKVEVIVVSQRSKWKGGERYPLRGKPVSYVAPFESVAESDWSALA